MTNFPMERKIIIIIVCLAASLIAGGFALAWKNRDALLAAAGRETGNKSWIEIKPRVDSGPDQTAAPGKASKTKKTKAGGTAAANPAEAGNVLSDKNAVQKPVAPIVWCAAFNEKVRVPAVIINEVAWMGTAASHNDEWIELKNLFRDPVDLGSWQLQNKNKSIKISFKEGSVVPAGGFYLLERTDDTTVPSVAADAIYTGNLANAKEALYLFDADCKLQDSVAASPAWPAGDNAAKRTMERTADLLWRTSILPGGTPKQENSVY